MPTGERFAIVPVRVLNDRRLSDGAIVTYAALASYANGAREAWPSWAELAGMRGVSRSSIAKHLAELVDAGHVERVGKGRYRLWKRGPTSRTFYPQGPDPDEKRSGSPERPLSQTRTEPHTEGTATFLPGTGWIR